MLKSKNLPIEEEMLSSDPQMDPEPGFADDLVRSPGGGVSGSAMAEETIARDSMHNAGLLFADFMIPLWEEHNIFESYERCLLCITHG